MKALATVKEGAVSLKEGSRELLDMYRIL